MPRGIYQRSKSKPEVSIVPSIKKTRKRRKQISNAPVVTTLEVAAAEINPNTPIRFRAATHQLHARPIARPATRVPNVGVNDRVLALLIVRVSEILTDEEGGRG